MFESTCKYVQRSSKTAVWFKGMVCADIYGLCKTLLSKQTTKTIVDIGLPAALDVVGSEELLLSSVSGSVSRDYTAMHKQCSPLQCLYKDLVDRQGNN